MSHWYLPNSEPFHFLENGKPTTLREARKAGASPSVTTILGILDKPALVNWKLKRVTGAAQNANFMVTEESHEDYHRRIMAVAFAESTDARDRGSEIHDCIEMLVRDEPRGKYDRDIQEIARLALLEILRYTKSHRQDFTPEQTVVGDGYGGMVDLHNDDFCIDWKTKDLTDDQVAKTKVVDEISRSTYLAWPEMSMQLAAYDQALSISQHGTKPAPGRRCINVFIDRTEPGKVVIHEWTAEEIKLAWQKFQLLVQYWRLDKNYFPTGE